MASTGETWRLGRRPALDGLRGIAILLVVVTHSHATWFYTGGAVGVTMFFTLSGFLITALMLEEVARTGSVALRGFYWRRARRLLPALLVFLAVIGPVALSAGPIGGLLYDRDDVPAVLLYVANWPQAIGGAWAHGLSHTWSLAVEEQFYLVWPLLVIAVVRWAGRWRRGALLAVCAAGSVYAVAARAVAWDGGDGAARVYYGTDTRADALLAGCALAAYLHHRPAPQVRAAWATVAVAVFVALGTLDGMVGPYLVVPVVVPVLTCVAILAVVGGPYRGALAAPWLRLVGRRSYGLYLWHFPLVWVFTWRLGIGPWWGDALALFAVSWVLASLSWRYVEQPAMRWRPRPRASAQSPSRVMENVG